MILVEIGIKDFSEMRAMNLDKLLEGKDRDEINMWGPRSFYRACLDVWLFPQTYEETLYDEWCHYVEWTEQGWKQ